jgi:cob(I)alamin adenosyltransferase
MSSIGRGYIHVYTGDGKGKTTAAFGLAFRAVGSGLKVLVIQFLKGTENTGERCAAEQLAGNLQVRSLGRGGLLQPGDIRDEDRVLVEKALEETANEMKSGSWDVMILDEINTACRLGLVSVEKVLQLMELKPYGMELVLTGRGAAEPVVERADLVTEMREVKHYFKQGVHARTGIEK